MKIIISLGMFIMLLADTCVAQQQVSISTAKIAAINTMRNNKLFYTAEDINSVNLYISKLDTILYEVKFNDNHSVLLSGSLACQPVLGYNFSYDDETALDHFDEIPPGLQFMIQEYIDQIELCFANDTITLIHADDWANLMNHNKNEDEVYVVVSPLITTEWGQRASNTCEYSYTDYNAYNYYVPATSNSCTYDSHCPTGCVATAMGQIMNYWKHPVFRGNSGSNQFDWCNMPDKLCTNSSNYDKERNAIASLLRKCGIETDMVYCEDGECESGTTIRKAKKALVKMFEYNSSANIKRKFFHPNNWSTLVRDNLDEGKPLLYAGENETSGHGHAFVCDGYRSDNTFHFNWGWRGLYNDYWLVLSSLSFSSYDYSDKQKAIFDIYPSNYYDYCDFSLSLEVYFSLYIFSSNPSIAVPRTFNVLQSVNRNSSLDAMYRTIPTGADIEYVAHQKVILVDGFHAEEGSHFVSYIDECEKCEEEDRLAERVGNIESFMEVKPSETESNIDNKVNIIPNPNNGSFCVSLTNNDEITGIKVFDTMGKIIYSNNRFNGGEVVLPDVKHGVYYVIVTLKDKTITEKIIIQ